jgi:hypothetical protein
MRVNAEQASKRTMCRPTRQRYRGRLLQQGEMSDDYAQPLHRGSGGSTHTRKARGIVMSGRRSLIKGYFWRCAGRGCGHVFGLSRGQLDPLALMLSADPLPRSEQRA